MSDHNEHHSMPRYPDSYWLKTKQLIKTTKLNEDIHVDIAIIGGGITGVTAAYLLIKEGYKVALVDAGPLLSGTTGHTTAKITVQHNLIYDEFIQHIGLEKAKLYYQSNNDALHFIENMIKTQNIDCQFSHEDAYLYTKSNQGARNIEKEWQAYNKLNIKGEMLTTIPLDMDVKAALQMQNQAQFHPILYLNHLIQSFIEQGGQIYDYTTAIDIEDGNPTTILTENGQKIICDVAIVASHFPFYDGLGFYFTRMHAERSYILAIKTQKKYAGGMYLSVDQTKRSLRQITINNDPFVLVGGESHKTGQGINTMKHYNALRDFAEDTFGIDHIAYRWSTQDLITIDKLPFVGPISTRHPNILVATGFRKWGMTNGTSAALLLKNIIMKEHTPYKDLYTPSRFYPDPSLKHFVIENANVAGELINGKFGMKTRAITTLKKDEAAHVLIKGQKAGAYRDNDGYVHTVDTTCTHLGCEVEWNDGERTWDCPCHGSRYTIDGEVIEGPAKKALKKHSITPVNKLN